MTLCPGSQDIHRSWRPACRAAALHLALLAAIAILAPAAKAQDTALVAFVGATIIDGNGGPPLQDGTLLVAGKRIVALGRRARISVPRGAQIINASGKYLVPGFIDTNVHVSLYGRGETVVRYQHQNAELVREAAQLHLKHGVTTIRDSYGSLLPLKQVRDGIARGDVIGPRMLVAGNIVGWGGPCSVSFSLTQESACSLFEEQFNDFITQGTGEQLMEMTLEELRVAISEYLDKDPDFIKFGGTSHFSPAFIGFSPDAQRVIVAETHERGLPAETHSTTIEGLRMSILAGIDLIQHPEALGRRHIPAELVRMIRERGIVCSMLANTYTGEPWQAHVESRTKAEMQDDEKHQAQERARTSAEQRREQRQAGLALEMRRRNAQELIRGGCLTTVGTDNHLGSAPEFRRTAKAKHQEAGLGTIAAIEGLVELGMTPAQAIVAATRNGAVATRGIEHYGTLETGKVADLLVLDADPLEDISNIRKLSAVMKEGRIVDRDALPANPIWHGRSSW